MPQHPTPPARVQPPDLKAHTMTALTPRPVSTIRARLSVLTISQDERRALLVELDQRQVLDCLARVATWASPALAPIESGQCRYCHNGNDVCSCP